MWSALLLSLAGTTAVLARPLPAAPECRSNAWELIHEAHWHNINNGDWLGLPIGLVFPGGSGCWHGSKVIMENEHEGMPDLSRIPKGLLESMPGYKEAQAEWSKPKAPKQPAAPVYPQPAAPVIPQPAAPVIPKPVAPVYKQPVTPTFVQPSPQPNVPIPNIPLPNLPQGWHLEIVPTTPQAASPVMPGMVVPEGYHIVAMPPLPETTRAVGEPW